MSIILFNVFLVQVRAGWVVHWNKPITYDGKLCSFDCIYQNGFNKDFRTKPVKTKK